MNYIRTITHYVAVTIIAAVWSAGASMASEPASTDHLVKTPFINQEHDTIGSLTAKATPHGVLVTIDVHTLSGTHGFHIHEHGICETPDFKSAGGHYNPNNHQHGVLEANGTHKGDLPNIIAANGHATQQFFINDISLETLQTLSFIIHADADDYHSQPSGNAGNRIACASFSKQ